MKGGTAMVWDLDSLDIRKAEGIMNDRDKRSVHKEMREAPAANPYRRPILLVEDDPDIRETLRMTLGRNYEVVGASSGNRILELLDGYEPVLVILDVNLPGKDGFELCRIIRSSPRHRHLPVLFLTVLRDDESFVKSLRAEADGYLNKPFEAKELETTVERLIRS